MTVAAGVWCYEGGGGATVEKPVIDVCGVGSTPTL